MYRDTLQGMAVRGGVGGPRGPDKVPWSPDEEKSITMQEYPSQENLRTPQPGTAADDELLMRRK
ncbi:TPA: hypothetical protein DCL30_03575 [Candidatus Peribacteria bacterium]|nr:hypothetical protein [Candidatus Peribacteria bacterium]